MRIFLICPVRNVTSEETEAINRYVTGLEERCRHRVYWPARDTDQSDPIGLQICKVNRNAIIAADEVHVWWNPASTGSLFDLGIAFALGKDIVLANEVTPTEGKSFNNFLLAVCE